MKNFKKLLFLLSKPDRKRAGLLLVLVIIMALLDMIGVVSIMPFMTVLTNPGIVETNIVLNKAFKISSMFGVETNQQFLFFLGVFVMVMLVISLAFKALTIYLQLKFTSMCQYRISKRFVKAYLYQNYSWFLNRHSADLGKTILSEVGMVVSKGLSPMISLITQSTIVLTLITMLTIVNTKIAIIIGLTISLSYFLIYKFVRSILSRIGEGRLKANQLRFTTIIEAFGSIKEIKIGSLEKNFVSRFSDQAKIFAKYQASGQSISMLPRFFLEAIAFGGMLLVVLYLIKQSSTFTDVLPIIALYAFAGYRLMPAFQLIYSNITSLRLVGPSLDAMYTDLKNLKPINDYHRRQNGLQLNKELLLKNINYNYPNSTKTTLKDVSLRIPAYSTVGFVGTTGSGKTTMIDIILGLLEPQQGTIEVDGKVINEENLKVWQSSIGYVPQEIYLADDTVSANIAFGIDLKDIDQDTVERCAKIANVHDFVVNELPLKYQATLGERGVRLSGGQRQRIGIARALYHNPKVLILDEATSSLDNLTEKTVMDSVHNIGNDITVILIAHRLNTVKKCDMIFLFENGALKNSGSFEKLSKESDLFQ